MPAEDAATPSSSVSALKQRIDELSVELRACTAERDEGMQRERALAEVLQAINASAQVPTAVFDVILEKAMRLCAAAFGYVMTYDGERFQVVASHSLPVRFAEYLRNMDQPGSTGLYAAIRRGSAYGQVADLRDGDVYRTSPLRRALVDLGGARTGIVVALRRDDSLLGVITIYRQEVRPFANVEIALLQNFAAQAVVAIDNSKLLGELRESEARYALVSDAVAEGIYEWNIETNALWVSQRLIEIFGFEGRELKAADWNELVHPEDFSSYRSALRDCFKGIARRLDSEYRVRHADGAYRWIEDRAVTVRSAAGRAVRLVGALTDVTARKESERALSEALQQQTATAEVLQVINASPGDLAPVFDAMLEKAMTLCGAAFGFLTSYDGQRFTPVAMRGVPPSLATYFSQGMDQPSPGEAHFRILQGEDVVHNLDQKDQEAYRSGLPLRRAVVDLGGARTALVVALRKDGAVLGALTIYRKEVRPFSDKQIALMRNFAAQAVIAIENARLLSEQREALERQTATAEVLEVINASPGDLRPVFDAILEKAMHSCEAVLGILWTYDGECYRAAAMHGLPEACAELFRQPVRNPHPEIGLGRILRGERLVINANMAAEAVYLSGDPIRRAMVDTAGARSCVQVALRKDDDLLGAFVIYRKEIRPFTDKQIALLQSFAAQAVIAMENARLLTEQREALEQQTATADILRIISQSPNDVQPVLNVVAEAAQRFCGAEDVTIGLREGESWIGAAHLGPMQAGIGERFPLNRQSVMGRSIIGAETVQVSDIDAVSESEFATAIELARRFGWRAAAAAPLVREGVAAGAILLRRPEAGASTPRQIELLETFAAQAVIAIENVRLFTELRESLEQQTATADILSVISRSPTDVQPVLEAVARAALRFCGAPDAIVLLRDGDDNVVVAHEGTLTATLGLRRPIAAANFSGQAMLEGRTLQIADVDALDAAVYAGVLALARQHKWRASAAAPMMHSGKAIGCVVLRKPEPGLLSPRQIALLETFAAQAVIAIENVRLFTELREALEQQTATAEILTVISQSPTDVGPVLSAVAKAAMKFCGANDALVALRDGDEWSIAAHEGPIETVVGTRRMLTRHTAPGRAMTDGKVVQIMDLQSEEGDEFPEGREIGARTGFRSALAAPLLRDDVSVGAISLRRREAGAFEPRQVELLKTFAAQAVIAIQNVRLFTELRESLEQQTATAEILRAISQSPTDVQPVLDVVAKAAVRFCGATDAVIHLRDGDEALSAAHEGPLRASTGHRRPLDRQTGFGTAILEGRTVQIPDSEALDPVQFPLSRRLAAEFGFRAALAVPLLREDTAIGALALRRVEPGSFAPQQIELLETFAAQAVIAIENVRLFTELRDSLERLKAAQANLIQAEKMASLGQLTAGIAHEIKNPLNFVNNFAGLSSELLDELKQAVDALLAEPDENKRAELQETMDLLTGNLAKIVEHGRRADGIVKSMLSHSRGGKGDWQECSINALVEEALNLAYHGARAQDQDFNVTLERDFAPETKSLEVVPQDVTRVFLNLFGNGFYATRKRHLSGADAGYRPTLTVSTRDLGDAVEVTVRDNGTGIQPDVRAKLFQPFFTTKPTGEGTGLGLSISYDIVTQQHGGSIDVESEPGSFTEFTVRLPRSRRVAQSRGA